MSLNTHSHANAIEIAKKTLSDSSSTAKYRVLLTQLVRSSSPNFKKSFTEKYSSREGNESLPQNILKERVQNILVSGYMDFGNFLNELLHAHPELRNAKSVDELFAMLLRSSKDDGCAVSTNDSNRYAYTVDTLVKKLANIEISNLQEFLNTPVQDLIKGILGEDPLNVDD